MCVSPDVYLTLLPCDVTNMQCDLINTQPPAVFCLAAAATWRIDRIAEQCSIKALLNMPASDGHAGRSLALAATTRVCGTRSLAHSAVRDDHHATDRPTTCAQVGSCTCFILRVWLSLLPRQCCVCCFCASELGSN